MKEKEDVMEKEKEKLSRRNEPAEDRDEKSGTQRSRAGYRAEDISAQGSGETVDPEGPPVSDPGSHHSGSSTSKLT